MCWSPPGQSLSLSCVSRSGCACMLWTHQKREPCCMNYLLMHNFLVVGEKSSDLILLNLTFIRSRLVPNAFISLLKSKLNDDEGDRSEWKPTWNQDFQQFGSPSQLEESVNVVFVDWSLAKLCALKIIFPPGSLSPSCLPSSAHISSCPGILNYASVLVRHRLSEQFLGSEWK